jgi:ribosomal protein L30E
MQVYEQLHTDSIKVSLMEDQSAGKWLVKAIRDGKLVVFSGDTRESAEALIRNYEEVAEVEIRHRKGTRNNAGSSASQGNDAVTWGSPEVAQ